MGIDGLRPVLTRINGEGARKHQHAEALAALDGLLEAVGGWVAMVAESGIRSGQLASAERTLLVAALGCQQDALDARLDGL